MAALRLQFAQPQQNRIIEGWKNIELNFHGNIWMARSEATWKYKSILPRINNSGFWWCSNGMGGYFLCTLCTQLLVTASSRMDSSKGDASRTLLNRCHDDDEELRHTAREQRGLAKLSSVIQIIYWVIIYFWFWLSLSLSERKQTVNILTV